MATTPTLSSDDTAVMLRARLGPLRDWRYFLADNIRGRQALAGHQLLPCCRQHDGRAYRPRYAQSDVEDFIAKVLAAIPTAGRSPIQATPLDLDTSRSWRQNKFDPYGNPVSRHRTMGTVRTRDNGAIQ